MKGFLKIALISVGALTSTIVVGGFFILKGLENSPLLDQRLSERYGLLRCFQKLSLGEFRRFGECSEYAQFHLPMYLEFIAESPEESACLVSKDILEVLRIDYPSSISEIKTAEDLVKRNCAI